MADVFETLEDLVQHTRASGSDIMKVELWHDKERTSKRAVIVCAVNDPSTMSAVNDLIDALQDSSSFVTEVKVDH